MLTRVTDFDRTFSVFDELRRRMDRVWDDFDAPDERYFAPAFAGSPWPKIHASDAGPSIVLRADVPGLTDKDITVTLAGSISGTGISHPATNIVVATFAIPTNAPTGSQNIVITFSGGPPNPWTNSFMVNP